jgi:tRNA threonylcarbamoyladenosine biosynthesis protein TsaE
MNITSEQEMIEFGYRLGQLSQLSQLSQQNLILSLQGDLGAGKTHFTKGIAKGLGILEEITSPTFTIVHEFEGETPLLHIDLYRLSADELQSIDLEEIIEDWQGWTVVEWGNLHPHILPHNHIIVHIIIEQSHRVIRFEPQGAGDFIQNMATIFSGLSSC